VPPRLTRYYGADYLHFITTSCYQRRALLASPEDRDLFLETFEEVRRAYRLVVAGYVVMPEHVHLLISEPERGDPSIVMQVLKQRFTRKLLRRSDPSKRAEGWAAEGRDSHPSKIAKDGAATAFWQRRFYDFPVWSKDKRIEKLRYMHRNPVKRGLVEEPDQWRWSSFRYYAYGESGPVLVNEERPAQMKIRAT
jgi:REP-associated tyrosine transposase